MNESPSSLAPKIGVKYRDVRDLADITIAQLDAPDRDPVLIGIQDFLDRKLGELLSLREQLQVKLAHDRDERAARARRITDGNP